MIIPHRLLSPDTLHGVIEALVTREGTDYGAHEVPLATKVAQVWQQLDKKPAPIDMIISNCSQGPDAPGCPLKVYRHDTSIWGGLLKAPSEVMERDFCT